jgi:hypothetical protein
MDNRRDNNGEYDYILGYNDSVVGGYKNQYNLLSIQWKPLFLQ